MPPAKVSVVIPLYNKGPYIRRAIDSVLAQSIKDFEIIVVDDGSTDEGGEVVGAIRDERIRLIRQANAGVSAARNRGILEARSDFIAFLDADDNYNPRLLEVQLGLRAKYPHAGAYGAGWEAILETGRRRLERAPVLRERRTDDALIENYFKDIRLGHILWTSTTAVPRGIFDKVGFFPLGVPAGEDIDLWIRIAARYPVAVSSYIGAVYHREAHNRLDDGRYKGIEYELVRTGLRLLESPHVPRARKRYLREYVAHYQIQSGFYLVLRGQRHKARQVLRECRGKCCRLRKWWWLAWTFVPTPITSAAEKLVRKTVWPSSPLPELKA